MKNKGFILINVLVFAVIAIVITTSLINWASTTAKSIKNLSLREQAFQIAEAGIDYYRWHLAHASNDYKDGIATTTNGPFIHNFEDKDGNIIGHYSLIITPPLTGSTLVKIKSTGTVIADSSISRTIQVSLAIPSFAKYAVVSNDIMRFGEGTEVFGSIHSNDGIRFDGIAHNIITSSKDKYIDPDNGSSQRFGVYTTFGTDDPSPPAIVPNRSDVFLVGRQFPVPNVDFFGITASLAGMKADAISNGLYFSSSNSQGYHIILKTNNTFDLYKVNSLSSVPNKKCIDELNQSGWGTWSINNESFIRNYSVPNNGIIFLEDNVWVNGQINSNRLTIAVGKFPDSPSTWKNIIINNDTLYTNYDGQDSLALIAQGNIITGLFSENSLKIDSALMAQNGKVGRYYYSDNFCGANANRSDITLYGMLGTKLRYGYAYTDGTGYSNRSIIYDGNLLYSPPPSFPLTSNQYSIISWEEIN